ILAELLGYGQSAGAYHVTAPPPGGEGAVRAMQMAITDADVPSERIGYVNAHGTSTQANDGAETAALKTVFGAHARKLAVSSTKSMTGHTLGAAGGLEGKRGGVRVRVAKDGTVAAGAAATLPPSAQSGARGDGGVSPPIAADLPTVNAPLTGVFYRSPSPQAQPYVQVGSNVAA